MSRSLVTWLLFIAIAVGAILTFGCGRERPIVVPETEQGE